MHDCVYLGQYTIDVKDQNGRHNEIIHVVKIWNKMCIILVYNGPNRKGDIIKKRITSIH